MQDIVIVENLVKRFRDVIAVNNISFKIEKGEIFALLGPNGAGKTTTIHIISTILRPTSGRVLVAGHDVLREPGEVRKKIGIVFQEPSLDNQLTAYDNMYIHGRLYGLGGEELREKIMRLLEFVNLKEYAWKKVVYFSGGMKRRLEIARSLLHEPEILILDEPTIGLDPQSRAKIWDYIRELRKLHNMTILLTTHYMDEAEELAHRVAIMDHGKIIALDTPDGLKNMLGKDVVYLNVNGGRDFCSAISFVKECRKLGENRYELLVDNASKLIPEIIATASSMGLEITEVSYKRPSLNEVFLHLTGRELRDSLEASAPMAFRGRRWR
ncbi:daunorubicin resistance ABC transporter ATPase subunit [Desulfurococcus amylolyticus 1221n]|uniref:Daunorubicin resistance ABC transporter ATPase subunit n=1 Tax=Desulfurococcus amylolyticus (strain DSM 18924 / JCM 16383 / VKM B-2413 / 1221n) TaxID=490899 RepID=B8D3Z2_DESA1|nr:daunorubicin resistance protein DrrA family ABC transporter ATP-binding protein [Desulfurococcus amylolyticus]ACL10823.1 daunorubicin resistance ABC transporter ATPase subunit [Desulfurococcus amylolyticus 1221n]